MGGPLVVAARLTVESLPLYSVMLSPSVDKMLHNIRCVGETTDEIGHGPYRIRRGGKSMRENIEGWRGWKIK